MNIRYWCFCDMCIVNSLIFEWCMCLFEFVVTLNWTLFNTFLGYNIKYIYLWNVSWIGICLICMLSPSTHLQTKPLRHTLPGICLIFASACSCSCSPPTEPDWQVSWDETLWYHPVPRSYPPPILEYPSNCFPHFKDPFVQWLQGICLTPSILPSLLF